MFCAVKIHMFHEMCQSLLVIILKNGTGIDRKPQLDPFFRFFIIPDVINKSVVKFPDLDIRINSNRGSQVNLCCLTRQQQRAR